MATFAELTAKVADWSNRSDLTTQIPDFLEIAQKRVNSMLRIAPMETIVMYTGIIEGQTTLAIPSDLIEIISIRTLDDQNNTINVFDNKIDSRSFDKNNTGEVGQYNYNFTFTRRAGAFVLSNPLGVNTKVELYYYRVLPKLNATYPDTVYNQTAGPGDTSIVGDEVPQWFRDEAEFLLLYGALVEVANYLSDPEDAQRWELKFQEKIKEIMDDEFKRENSGGTLTQNIGTNGLI